MTRYWYIDGQVWRVDADGPHPPPLCIIDSKARRIRIPAPAPPRAREQILELALLGHRMTCAVLPMVPVIIYF